MPATFGIIILLVLKIVDQGQLASQLYLEFEWKVYFLKKHENFVENDLMRVKLPPYKKYYEADDSSFSPSSEWIEEWRLCVVYSASREEVPFVEKMVMWEHEQISGCFFFPLQQADSKESKNGECVKAENDTRSTHWKADDPLLVTTSF